ncbi:protein P54-like isoform X2 [Megalobrama amblycephala]|nr:protein P54-like isoform X2 [Megalobrama amblycephala]
MASLQSPLLANIWKQSPLKLTVIMALTVAAAEIIIDMAGPAVFNRVVGPVAGAATGAGLCILRSLREAGVREEASIVGAAAAAGGVAGTVAADILQVLSGSQSQRGSTIIGTMAGAEIIAVSGLHMQLLIDTVKRVIALVEREISAIQWGTKVTKLASLTATIIAAVLKMSQSAALAIAAGAAAASDVVAGASAEGSTASGVAATVIRVSKSAIAAVLKMSQSAALAIAAGAAAASDVVAGAEASGVAAEGSTASGVAATVIGASKSAEAAVFKVLQSAALGAAAARAAAESDVAAGAEASGVAAEGSTASGVAATVIGLSKSGIAAVLKMSQRAASSIAAATGSGVAAAAGTVEGHVAGSGINGSQQEGQSDTQAPVMVKAPEEQIHSSELKKTEFLEEKNKEWQHKHTKAETEAKDLRFTGSAAPVPPPPPAPSSNPLSSLQSILPKKKSTEIALVEKDSSKKTPEKEIRQQTMDEIMQQIKNGVQLRHVSQTTNRAKPGPVSLQKEQTTLNDVIEELQGILTSVKCPGPSSPGTHSALLKAVLKKALQQRREAFHPN